MQSHRELLLRYLAMDLNDLDEDEFAHLAQ